MKHTTHTQSGNVFFIILIGIALFGALGFSLTRSTQTSTVTKMSERELKLVTTDVLNYAQRAERAVDKVRRNGCSENDISFENTAVSGYEHTPDVADKCKIFTSSGGALTWQAPQPSANNGTPWFFGANRVRTNNNAQALGTPADELTLVLPNITNQLCDNINEEMNNPDVWESVGQQNGGTINTKFIGSYAVGGNGINRANLWPVATTGCFCDNAGGSCSSTDPRYFYHVLLIR